MFTVIIIFCTVDFRLSNNYDVLYKYLGDIDWVIYNFEDVNVLCTAINHFYMYICLKKKKKTPVNYSLLFATLVFTKKNKYISK